jgi:hypothetical protein
VRRQVGLSKPKGLQPTLAVLANKERDWSGPTAGASQGWSTYWQLPPESTMQNQIFTLFENFEEFRWNKLYFPIPKRKMLDCRF